MFAMLAVVVALIAPSTNRWEVVKPYNAKLERMAYCESRGNWRANTGNGYFGGLQFSLQTWRAAGGVGLPHRASKLEQKYRAVIVIKMPGGGYGHWPICGRS